MTALTIVLLVSLGLVILLVIIIFLTEKSKVSKDDSSEVKKGEEDKKESSHDKHKEHTTKGGCIGASVLIIFIIIFLCLVVYVIVDYYQEKVYPWDYEVNVVLWEKFSDGSEKKRASFQTPMTIPFDYAFDLRTKGFPYAVLWSGTTVPICYCDDDKDPHISERYPGPNTITKPSEACWKMCRDRKYQK